MKHFIGNHAIWHSLQGDKSVEPHQQLSKKSKGTSAAAGKESGKDLVTSANAATINAPFKPVRPTSKPAVRSKSSANLGPDSDIDQQKYSPNHPLVNHPSTCTERNQATSREVRNSITTIHYAKYLA